MIHTVIVPGVGGSDQEHWQSWLQRQLMSCSRVSQADWNQPILAQWIENLVTTLNAAPNQVQIVAHSFGCLTSVAALAQHPILAKKVKKMLLVAPANPARFGEHGFVQDHLDPTGKAQHYAEYFLQLRPSVHTEMIISENDPWLALEDAKRLANAWQVPARNLGQVGHINIASGFGPFPEIYQHLMPEKPQRFIRNTDEGRLFLKLAI